jgi:hypothetical protein
MDTVLFLHIYGKNRYCIVKNGTAYLIKVFHEIKSDVQEINQEFKLGKKEILKKFLQAAYEEVYDEDEMNCGTTSIYIEKKCILRKGSIKLSQVKNNIDAYVDIFDDIADNNQPSQPNQLDQPNQPSQPNQLDQPSQPTPVIENLKGKKLKKISS